MPINHKVSFKPKCPDDPAARRRIPGCSTGVVSKFATPQPQAAQPQPAPPQPTPQPLEEDTQTFNPLPVKPETLNKFIPTNPSSNPVPPNFKSEKNESDKDKDKIVNFKKFEYVSETTRLEHINQIKKFADHPNMTPNDRVAAEISRAAYITDPDILEDYISRISHLGEDGWELHLDPLTRNTWMKTYRNKNSGRLAIGYRGTKSWIGADGLANLTNTSGITEATQFLENKTSFDIRTGKAQAMDETNRYIANLPEEVDILGGHSQGAWDGVYGKRNYHQNAETIVFQPAPGGVPSKFEGRTWTTPNDFVSVEAKIKGVLDPEMYEVNTVRATASPKIHSISPACCVRGALQNGGHAATVKRVFV